MAPQMQRQYWTFCIGNMQFDDLELHIYFVEVLVYVCRYKANYFGQSAGIQCVFITDKCSYKSLLKTVEHHSFDIN
mgnify:CR=1 FL=1